MKNLSKVSCSAFDSDPRSGQVKEGVADTPTTSTAEQPRFRIKGSTMAKFSSVAVLLAILVIVVLVVLSESATTRQVKKVVTRRKKVATTTTTTPVPTTVTTTTTTEPTTTTELISEPVILAETESSVFPASGEDASPRNPDSSESSREDPLLVGSSQEDESPTSSTAASSSKRRNAARGGLVIPDDCPDCIQEACPSPPDTSNCPMGLVLDRCSCCFLCAAAEGNRCYNASLKIAYKPEIRNQICGPGLACLLRGDLEPNEPPESLCECRDKRKVCGNDGVTYSSECKLREAAHSNPALIVKAWRPCVSAPAIPSPMDNVTVAAGEDASLSCEVRSFPNPIIHWEFLAENSMEPIVLPGDDSSIVVTIRGGPEEQLTSSYLQIVSVTPRVQGMYFCIGNNKEGTAQTVAFVSVYNKFTAIDPEK